tara:strand:- start:14716 stop:15876 length:1161 start_codon:yes stop_codon:yes gene_type:complete
VSESRPHGQRSVYVIGIGMHRYQFPSSTPYPTLGLTAVREALTDSGLAWPAVQAAYLGSTGIGMAAGRVMLRYLGSTGLSVTQVENASASGSSAFRLACLDVASGETDVALAIGVDKFGDGQRAANKTGLDSLCELSNLPPVKFALMTQWYCDHYGVSSNDLARVALKNHNNAARNPYAQFQKRRTLDDILGAPPIAGALTALQCCPRGEGAAAAIVVSEDAMRRLGLDRKRAVRVASSTSCSETHGGENDPALARMVRASAEQAYQQAGIGPDQLDLVELHDAFPVEEIVYGEALGLAPAGEGLRLLLDGDSAIGGRCAINASGGLLGMGHPLGPTGIGQVAEIVRQLRGEASGRQQPDARIGLAHMIGLGSVAVAHVLIKDTLR